MTGFSALGVNALAMDANGVRRPTWAPPLGHRRSLAAEAAKVGCPISKALSALEISLDLMVEV